VADSELGCALGAARLARMAGGAGLEVATKPQRLRSYLPRADRVAQHAERHVLWQQLYPLARSVAGFTSTDTH